MGGGEQMLGFGKEGARCLCVTELQDAVEGRENFFLLVFRWDEDGLQAHLVPNRHALRGNKRQLLPNWDGRVIAS